LSHSERVSIVVPFYRAELYIEEAIQSILSQQDYSNWRLYLIDDGSDERDTDIAARYAAQHPAQICLIRQPDGQRRGTSSARNLGIRRSSGELIAFLDADDVWFPHKLWSQVALIDKYPEASMLFGPALRWWSWMGGADVLVPTDIPGYGVDCLVPGDALLAHFLQDETRVPCTGSVMIRREALDRCGYFEDQFPGLYDDQVLYSKLCLNGSVYVSSDCVSRYRQHGKSCCGKAEAEGTAPVKRAHFLQWLTAYQGRPSLR
jgi:glycosyltransferase involved in cell wall biosynthesis